MPHIAIDGDVDLEAYAREFTPILLRQDGDVLRADRVLVDPTGQRVLVEALVIEAGRKQPFYIRIARRDRGASVRVDPLTHPERSAGVRALVAHVGAVLLERSPGAEISATNLVIPSPGSGGEA